jgi:peptidoglycan/LPS O-acetylase OafA/YrhL
MQQPTHKYLSNLTPLRGIAAIWVNLFHYNIMGILFVLPSQSQLLEKGYLMVDLFFIMSGFIICHVYQKSFLYDIKFKNFKKFIVARFARVYPLHFFTLLYTIIFIAHLHRWNRVYDPNAIPTNFLLLHSFGIHNIYTWNVPSWSISAEWWAYMAFPLIMLFINRKKNLAMILLAVFSASAYIAIIFWLPRHDPFDPKIVVPHNLDSSFDFGFLRGLAGFICGMLVYKIYASGLLNKIFQKDITAIFIMLITLICLHVGINDGFYIILFIPLVLAFALNNRRLHYVCNSRLLQYLGKISYSIYLSSLFADLSYYHLTNGIKLPGVLYLDRLTASNFWVGLGYYLVFLVLIIGFASLTYYIIEKPCRKYINAKWGKEKMPVYA